MTMTMTWLRTLTYYTRKYRAELLLAALSSLMGVVLTEVLSVFVHSLLVDRVQIILSFATLVFVFGHAFVIKRNVTSQLWFLSSEIGKLAGRSLPTLYDERKKHFPAEKSLLIDDLVQRQLPETIQSIVKGLPSPTKISIVVDSGTTLEQFFPRIKLLGLGSLGEEAVANVEIFTNSLSGSDAFCRGAASRFGEEQLHLFGGTPVQKYRAVLGDVTLRAMQSLKEECEKQNGIVVGLITANWILVGPAYDSLILCTSERGHLDYKKQLASMADYLYVVAPLGKLLRSTVKELNQVLHRTEKRDKYDGFDVVEFFQKTPDRIRLLTTHRTNNNSILFLHSENLRQYVSAHKRYTLIGPGRGVNFDPSGTRVEQREIEMPHVYVRPHSKTLLLC